MWTLQNLNHHHYNIVLMDERDKNQVCTRFWHEVDSICLKYSLQQLVLVVDVTSVLLISNLFVLTDLVAHKITFVEKLELQRKKLPYHVLYFIMPSQINIEQIIQDFNDKDAPKYKKAHLIFTTFLHQDLLKKMAGSKTLLKKIARNSIQQFYHSCQIIGHNVLNLEVNYLSTAYSRKMTDEQLKRVHICKKLVQTLANVQRLNCIRIYYRKSANKICEQMANSLQNMIQHYIEILIQNKSSKLHKDAKDIVYLLVDRSLDPVTPLIHSFTYEAMLFDLLRVTFEGTKQSEQKQYYIHSQFNDEIYEQFRYKHISLALSQLPQRLEEINNKLKNINQQQNVQIGILNQQYKLLKKHIQLLQITWRQFKNKKLDKLGQLEQCLVTGLTNENKNTSSSHLLADAMTQISHNEVISQIDKIRIALLVLCTIKLSKKDYQSLLDLFPEHKNILKNIIVFGMTYDATIGKSTKAITKEQQVITSQKLKENCMPLDRYTCILELLVPMVLDILSGLNPKITELEQEIFGKKIISPLGGQQRKLLPENLILMMCGGLSLSEICALKNKLPNIIISTDQIITPQQYLQQLADIKLIQT